MLARPIDTVNGSRGEQSHASSQPHGEPNTHYKNERDRASLPPAGLAGVIKVDWASILHSLTRPELAEADGCQVSGRDAKPGRVSE